MEKYKTLADLKEAAADGQLPGGMLWLDNDEARMYVDGECVFSMHPSDLLEQALDLLGIRHEHV